MESTLAVRDASLRVASPGVSGRVVAPPLNADGISTCNVKNLRVIPVCNRATKITNFTRIKEDYGISA